jgi:hypothetical protein
MLVKLLKMLLPEKAPGIDEFDFLIGDKCL